MARPSRSFGGRLAAPLLAAMDRRFDQLARRLEQHTTGLVDAQRAWLDQHSQRLSIDLRVVDEHLLAIERATRRVEAAASPHAGGAPFTGPGLYLVVPAGSDDVELPSGYVVADRQAAESEGTGAVDVLHLERRP